MAMVKTGTGWRLQREARKAPRLLIRWLAAWSTLAPVRWRQTEPALVCKECTVWSGERGSAYLMGRISLEAATAVVCEGGPLVVVSLEAVFVLGVVGWACGVSRFAALLFDELVKRLSNIGGHLGRVSSSGELPSVEFSFN